MADEVKATAKKAKKEQTYEQWLQEKVPVFLQYDKEHTEPLFVGINDRTFRIPRGVNHLVPRYVKIHLDEMAAQDMNTIRLINGLRNEFEASAAAHGLQI